eukprot:TRINITY_DN1677_c1_g2_i2.p1 TRINITY_DN1677_c1_g2~~TRINITY_DN1677_c1_g2_i2.p1  ORF type:complete len:938 (+),score=198.17 TRINITY_DN1677_c1_g2_i2:60-2873(+)
MADDNEAIDPVQERIKNLKTRGRVLNEVINTEKDFVDDMKFIIQYFKTPLEKSGIISENESTTLFGNIAHLIDLNEHMLMTFNLRKAECESQNLPFEELTVGDVFCEMATPLMKYEPYCANQTDAFAFLEEAKVTNQEFSQFHETCMNDTRCRGLGLQAWLIKPLQRLCKYPLLLRELVKCTPQDLPDAKHLKEAEAKIGVTVSLINAAKDKAEKEASEEKRFLTQVMQMLKTEDIELIKVGRKLVKTGNFQTFSKKKTKKRHVSLFLFTDLLMLTGIHKGKHLLYFYLLLRNVKLTDLGDTVGHSFEIQDTENLKNHYIFCETAEEKREWLKLIRSRVKDYQIQKVHKKTFNNLGKETLTSSGSYTTGTPRSLSSRDSLFDVRSNLGRNSLCRSQVIKNDRISPEKVESCIKPLDENLLNISDVETSHLSTLDSKSSVLLEIMGIEKDFWADMSACVELLMRQLDEDIILTCDVWKLFSNLHTLLPIHQQFLEKMDTRIKEVGRQIDTIKLGDIFFTHAEQLVAYEQFFSNVAVSLNVAEVLMLPVQENKQFIELVDKFESDPLSRGHSLVDYLKKPVKQLVRYTLFIKELRKHTAEDQPDFKLLKDAELRMDMTMQNLISKLKNGYTTFQSQYQFVSVVSKNFVWPKDNTKPIIINKPGRTFTQQTSSTVELGESTEKSPFSSPSKVVGKEVILFSDLVIVAVPEQGKTNFEVNDYFWIKLIRDLNIVDTSTLTIEVVRKDQPEIFTIVFDNEEDTLPWFNALSLSIQNITKQACTWTSSTGEEDWRVYLKSSFKPELRSSSSSSSVPKSQITPGSPSSSSTPVASPRTDNGTTSSTSPIPIPNSGNIRDSGGWSKAKVRRQQSETTLASSPHHARTSSIALTRTPSSPRLSSNWSPTVSSPSRNIFMSSKSLSSTPTKSNSTPTTGSKLSPEES